jgi:hypothetical protein
MPPKEDKINYKIAYSKLELKISKKFKGKLFLFQEIMTGTIGIRTRKTRRNSYRLL